MKVPAWLGPFLTLGNALALALLLLSVGAFVWLQRSHEGLFTEKGFQAFVEGLGPWGPLVYMAMIALSVVVSQLPGVPLTIAAGALWGAVPAGIYSVLGGFTGGLVAYFLGRMLGRSAMKALTGKVVVFDKTRGERTLGAIILVSRALPVLSFDLVSYAAGVTGLSLPVYAVATLVGMIPSTFLLAYLGSAFSVSLPLALSLSAVAVVVLVALPWIVNRTNLWGLKDIVRLE